MLFLFSFFLFLFYTILLVKNKRLRWIGWVFAAFYFMAMFMFGDVLRVIFHLGDDAGIFLFFIAVIATVTPLILGEIAARILKTKILRPSDDL